MRKFPVPLLALVLSTLVWCSVAWAQSVESPDLVEFRFYFQHLAALDAAADKADSEGTPGADTDGWRRYEQNAAGLNDREAAILKDVAYRCNQAIRDRESAPEPRPETLEILSAAVEELRTQLAPEAFESLARRIEGLIRPGIAEVPAARASGAEKDDLEPQAVEMVQVISLTGKFQDGFFIAECATARQGEITHQRYISGVSSCVLYGSGQPPIPLGCGGPPDNGICIVFFPPGLPGQQFWTQASHFLQMYHPDNCLGTGASGLEDPLRYCGRNPPSIVDSADILPLGGGVCWPGYPQTDLCLLATSRATPITYLDISPRQATVSASGKLQFTTPDNMPATWSVINGPGAIDDSGLYKAPASVDSQKTATIHACDVVALNFCVNATVTVTPLKVAVVSRDFEVLPGGETTLTATVTPAAQGQELEWSRSPAVGLLTASGNSATYKAPSNDDLSGAVEITVQACLKPAGTVCGTARVLVPKIAILLSAEPPTHKLASGQTIKFFAVVNGSSLPRELRWEALPELFDAPLTVDPNSDRLATYRASAFQSTNVLIQACLKGTVEDICEKYPLEIEGPLQINSVTGDWTAGQLDSSFTITGSGFSTSPVFTVNGLGATVLSASGSLITGAVSFPVAMGGTQVGIAMSQSSGPPVNFPSAGQTGPTIAPVSRLEVSPAIAEVREGGSRSFSAICLTAKGAPCNSPDAALVRWTASQGTIDPIGPIVQYRAPASVPASTTAAVTACWGTLCAPSALVTLLPPVAVTVSPKPATVSAGQTQPFTATVTNTANTAVTWSLAPETPEAGHIDQNGLYTAPATLGSVTTVTVIATSQADTTRKDTATVTLLAPCSSQYKSFQVLAGRCSVVNYDHEITVTPGYNFEVRTALQPTDGSAVDSRCFRFEWTSSLDPTPVGSQSFTVPGVPMILTLKVTSLDNAYSDSLTLTVKTDPNAYNSCVRRRSVRSSGGSSSGGSSAVTLSALSTLIQPGESVTLSPPEGINGSSFDWHRADPNTTDVIFSHDATVTVSPTVDTRYWLVYRYTDSNGVFHEEQSEDHHVLINRPAPPRVHIEPRFQVVPADNGPVMEVIDDAVTDGNYDGYTFEWNVGSDNTRPSTPLPWPYRRLVLDRAYDSSFWCKVTDRNGNVMVTEVATVAVTCSDGLRGSIGVSPGNYLSKTDRPVVSAYAQGLRLSYDWFERLPEETTPRPYSAIGAAISPAVARPLTYYSARIQDACGQTAVLPETPVYLCLPTIDSQPVDQVVPRGGSTSLTVAASPAIAGQPLTIAWRSGETGQVVGSGPTLNITPAPGTTQTFYAEVSADCSGTPRGVQTPAATVTGCALAATAYSDRNIALGQTVTLSASLADALVPPTDAEYTWYYGPAPGTEWVSDVGRASIDVTPQTTTTYWVRANDGTCTAASNTVTVRICVPVITSQPQGSGIRAGQTANLSVGVAPLANETLQYQWYTGASGDITHPVSGATSSTFTTPALAATTSYWVRVTSSCGATKDSAAAVVTVCNNPAISSVTPTRYVRYPESTWHQVYATGNNLTYQWYTGSPGNTSAPIAGATQSSISKAPAATTTYWARVTSTGLCTTDSPAMVIDVCTDPLITAQPASATISSGQSAPLSVATSATGATYQWYLGTGASIQGATSASLTVTPTADTQYYAQVTRGACTSTSATATVTVCTLAASLSGGANIASGQNATLGAAVSNSRATYANYDWYAGTGANSTLIAQGSGLAQKTVNPTATTQYWVRASDGICTVDSAPVTVRVCVPVINSQPQGSVIRANQTASLSVGVTPMTNETLQYQWYKGASGDVTQPLSGATSSTFTTPALAATTSYWVRVTSSCGATKDSAAAVVTVCNNPAISSVTPTRYVRYPESTWHQVYATGNNLTYQWYTGSPGNTSAPIGGATQSSISKAPAATTTYWARVTSTGLCTTDSPAMVIDVCTDPPITTQPASKTISGGQSAPLSVATSATGATYQWYLGTGASIQGATSASLTVTPTADSQYYAQVTRGACTSTSATATVTVCTLAASLSGGANIAYGQSATLGAAVSNSRATYASYEWYAGTGANSLLVAQGSGLGQKTVTPSITTQYWVRVSDGACTADSAPVTVSVCKPTLTAQPQGTTVNSGQTATLSVSASGAPLSYQWYIGAAGNTAQPIAGATSASYTTPPMSATTSYWVRVTGCTTADSVAATVNVCAPPAITSGPTADSQRFPGTTGWMTVTATGTNLTYQWFTGQSGDTTVPAAGPGCNSPQCSFTLSTSKYYWVRIIGTCGTLNSPAVIHPVSPSIYQQPQSASVPPNATPTLSVGASGTTLTYQWYRGYSGNTATPMSGATGPTFTVPPVSASASYWCKVTSAGDSTAVANSAEATLSLCTGPTIYYLYPQYLGYNQWRLSLGIGEEDLGNVNCAWYTGVPGNVAQSVLQYEGGTYTNVLATGTQTWWCRAWYADNSCYTDTGGATTYKVQ